MTDPEILGFLYLGAGYAAERDRFCSPCGSNISRDCIRFFSAVTDSFAWPWEQGSYIDIANPPCTMVEEAIMAAEAAKKRDSMYKCYMILPER